jgi:arylsulfatase A-like enzyme
MKRTLLILALAAAATFPSPAANNPNVILFLVDDMGWMDCEPYGSKYYETPHMSRLAGQSMRFTDAYALPLCSPTRASILSGQYSSRHRVTSASGHQAPAEPGASPYPEKESPAKRLIYAKSKNYLDPALIVLPEVLKAAGYRTAHLGKWHLGLLSQHRPDKHGFDTVFHCAPDPGPPNYFSPYGVHPYGTPTGQHKVGNITDGPDGEHIADRLTDEAIKFIEKHKGESFYLNFWHYSVHGPWQHKEEFTREFAKKKDPRGEQSNPVMASMLQCVDDSLGRLLDKLDELDLTKDTIFIFYSDNGGNVHSWKTGDRKIANVNEKHRLYETINSYRKWAGGQPPTNNAPLREGKARIYEGGQRVPLMVRWPGTVKAGSTTDAVVGPIDIYPTILDALGLEKPAEHIIDGKSFVPVLDGSGELQRDALFTWFPHIVPAVSVRAGDWKLIRRFEPHPDYPELHELYNLKKDIGETNNLAEKMPDKVKQLDALIDRFIEDTGALAPKPNPAYNPATAKPARGPDAGLVPKQCKTTLVAGALRMEGTGAAPFLGTASLKHAGPLTMQLRLRSKAGGAGKIWWKTAAQNEFPADSQIVPFEVPAGEDWQDIRLSLPVKGTTAIIRTYLPAADAPVDIESIRFLAAGSKKPVREWSFGAR